MNRQQGFTLIEVVVAFAIFALSVGAIYGLFQNSIKRTVQADQREVLLLTAQSLLSQLRMQSDSWSAEQSGTTSEGLSWRAAVTPFKANIAENSKWKAVEVTVSVSDPQRPQREYSLRSIELAHPKIGDQP